MNLPLSWLKQFINIKAKPQEIASKLTLSGSEVENILDNSKGLSKVVVGKIEKIAPHPDADKLQLAFVDVGNKEDLKIVCGAKNIKPGQKVPLALLGGSVPGMKIEARKIRGIASEGMLCSQRELGIGDDHSGIYILPNDAKIGQDVVKFLELDNPVLELDITPNRPDCFSIRGLAREVAALYGRKISEAPLRQGFGGRASSNLRESGTSASSAIKVKVEDKKLCPKYCARIIQGVKVGKSPLWVQNRLQEVGIRPINSVVDVTNYLMIELGHPMHVFDANLLNGDTIIVRKAKDKEKILALDEENYSLDSSMLVIADNKKPVAIAGIMGGQESSVTDSTQNVILESAVFDQVSIRKTSKVLGLRSESSSRFEKGIDLEVVEEAINKAAQMISEFSGGVVLKGIVSFSNVKKESLSLSLSVKEVERILGIDMSSAKIKSILESLGFEVKGSPPLNPPLSKGGENILKVQVPSWRIHDVKAQEDLIEEIGRMLDYNKLPKTLPTADLVSPTIEPLHKLRHDFRDYLTGIGNSEILTYSFYNEALLNLSGIAKSCHINLTNPVNDEYPYLRTSLLPWMLSKLSQNSSLLSRDVFQLFEIGKIFNKESGEKWQASIGFIDVNATDEQLYRKLRGIIETFIGIELSAEKQGKQYNLLFGKHEIAQIKIYPKSEIKGMRFRSAVAVMLINLEEIIKIKIPEKGIYIPIPYYPVVERDLGVIVPNMVQYKDILKSIKSFNKLIKKVELFDVYHGLTKAMSIALRLTFSSTDRTLESREVDEIISHLRASLEKKYKVEFR